MGVIVGFNYSKSLHNACFKKKKTEPYCVEILRKSNLSHALCCTTSSNGPCMVREQ